jgi:CheY-like chemotaxis protein
MGGHELAERLRSERPGLRVLFCSGYVHELEATGSDPSISFLAKPFRPAQLSRCVRELLDRESRATSAAR